MEHLKLKVAVYLFLIKDSKILLLRRKNTGWNDGNYSVPAGHLEENETIREALIRESEEEIGLLLTEKNIQMVHTMHRPSHIDFYFTAKDWSGGITNKEPHKCDDLSWFSTNDLPENMVPSVKFALENYQEGTLFSEHMK